MPLSVATIITRSVAQLADRAFIGAILRALGWTALCAIIFHLAVLSIVRSWFAGPEPLGLLATIAAMLLASALSLWLFLPTASAIAALHVERISRVVEERHYPWLPPAAGAPLMEQVHDALALAGRLLLLGALALALAFTVPGLGLLLAWLLTGYALGRGMFLSVAMRRMDRPSALALYRRHRLAVMMPALAIATGAWLPLVNLFVPVLALAAMVHVLVALAGWKPPLRNVLSVDNPVPALSPPPPPC